VEDVKVSGSDTTSGNVSKFASGNLGNHNNRLAGIHWRTDSDTTQIKVRIISATVTFLHSH
jgi:hypothetical protein